MVIKFGKWLTRHKAVVLIIAFLLLIPATIGYVSTRINYDLLSYLPNSLETVSGQDTMVDEFGMGSLFHDCRRRHGEEGHCGSQRKIEKSESCGGCYLV